jgi:uncharacterized protein YcnI
MAGAALLASAGAAYGHAALNAVEAQAGALTIIEFRITHGCGGSPTTRVTLEVPEGVIRVSPRMLAGWTVTTQTAPLAEPIQLHGQTVTDRVSAITWEGGSIPEGVYEQFDVRLQTPNEPGAVLVFPVRQECANGGRYDWDDDPRDGPTETPALMLRLTAPPQPPAGHH